MAETKLEAMILALIEKCRRFDVEHPGPYDEGIPGNLHLFEAIADELETGILPVMQQEPAAARERVLEEAAVKFEEYAEGCEKEPRVKFAGVIFRKMAAVVRDLASSAANSPEPRT